MERNFHGRWWLTSPVHQGDHGGAVKTIAQGMPFVSGGPCECACVFFFYCTRGCGCIEHPAFPAPSIFRRRENFQQNSGARRGEIAEACSVVIAPRIAGDPVRRGFSVQSPASLEYRVARSRLRDDVRNCWLFEN